MTWDQDDDVQALRRMLPVPAERDFPAGRQHQREEHLMSSWLRASQRPDWRKSMAVRVAVPMGLAAAVAGATLTLGHQPSPPARAVSAAPGSPAPAWNDQSVGRIETAAYALERQPGGVVKLTMETLSGTPNVEGMRADLARVGVRARVYVADPTCRPALPTPTTPAGTPHDRPDPNLLRETDENGKQVAYVQPDKLPADVTLIFVAEIAPDRPGLWNIGGIKGQAPDCMPASSSLGSSPSVYMPDGKVIGGLPTGLPATKQP